MTLAKSFNILTTSLSVLHSYFDGPKTKLFLDLYLSKFLALQQNRSFHLEINRSFK